MSEGPVTLEDELDVDVVKLLLLELDEMTLDVELLVLIELLLLLLDELVEEVFELPPQLVTNKPKASKDKTFVAFMIFPLI